MRTEAADSHMKWRELGKERGRREGGREGVDAKEGKGSKMGLRKIWRSVGVLVERNEGDLESYEEPMRGGVQRKLALIAK